MGVFETHKERTLDFREFRSSYVPYCLLVLLPGSYCGGLVPADFVDFGLSTCKF